MLHLPIRTLVRETILKYDALINAKVELLSQTTNRPIKRQFKTILRTLNEIKYDFLFVHLYHLAQNVRNCKGVWFKIKQVFITLHINLALDIPLHDHASSLVGWFQY